MNWNNFKQTAKKHMGMDFNYKTEKIYYHSEWMDYNLNEIKIKLDKVRAKIKQRARPPR
jgi:hypothetical protein